MTEAPSAPATTVLSAEGIVKRFGRRQALRGVSLEAAAGELVAVIGPNGAGKTTLLSILAGVEQPNGGRIATPGAVGWVPQQLALYGKLTVAENLRLFAHLERRQDVDDAVAQMLEQTGLAGRADDLVSTLSGGNRQRVNVAIGLLAQPSLLLLDEPTTALDPQQRQRLWEFILARAAAGTTIVYSTHNVGEAARFADRVLVLADGEVLFTGPPDELERLAGAATDFEAAFVAFLRERGHGE